MKTKTPPIRSEHDEQVALFKMIRLYSIKHPALKNAFAIPNGGQRHKAVAAKLKAEGVSPGYPDIALDWPSRDYHGLRIELKRDSKRACMSGNQIEWFARLSDAGYLCQCCHGWRNAWATICWYLKINPK